MPENSLLEVIYTFLDYKCLKIMGKGFHSLLWPTSLINVHFNWSFNGSEGLLNRATTQEFSDQCYEEQVQIDIAILGLKKSH